MASPLNGKANLDNIEQQWLVESIFVHHGRTFPVGWEFGLHGVKSLALMLSRCLAARDYVERSGVVWIFPAEDETFVRELAAAFGVSLCNRMTMKYHPNARQVVQYQLS